jgi:hypothetical protein
MKGIADEGGVADTVADAGRRVTGRVQHLDLKSAQSEADAVSVGFVEGHGVGG